MILNIKRLFVVMCLLLSLGATAQEAQELSNIEPANVEPVAISQVSFKSKADFLLTGHYFAGAEKKSGVIILHDCKSNSESFIELAKSLSKSGLHALALNLRGFGGSISNEFSHFEIKRQSKDIVSYQAGLAGLTSYWDGDIFAAYTYLRNQMANNADIAIVSSGCSASFAINFAEKVRLAAMVMITPKLTYMDKEKYKNLIDFPAYFLTSEFDRDTYQTSLELYQWNGDKRSAIQIFKGARVGHALSRTQPYIYQNISKWLSHQL